MRIGVNFINVLRMHFSYQRRFGSFFSSYMYFTYTWKKLPERLSYEKLVRIKLMKLTDGRLSPKPQTDGFGILDVEFIRGQFLQNVYAKLLC